MLGKFFKNFFIILEREEDCAHKYIPLKFNNREQTHIVYRCVVCGKRLVKKA